MKKWMFPLTVLLAVSGCGESPSPKKGDDKANALVQTYVVKGDPHLLIAGATLRPQSPFNEDNLSELENYSFSNIISYNEKDKSKKTEATQESIEAENAPRDGNQLAKKLDLRMKLSQGQNGTWLLKINTLNLILVWSPKANRGLELTGVQASAGGPVEALKVLHWSRSEDQSYLSVLVESSDPETGRSLTALYFERNLKSEMILPAGDKRYQYSQGPGVAYAWDASKVLNIQVCGSPSAASYVLNAVKLWQSPLQGRLQLKVTQAEKYFPFTEFNQHCVYVVDTYLISLEDNAATYGVTISLSNHATGKMIDSDIFIYKGEFEKLRKILLGSASKEKVDEVLEKNLVITFNHEFGHLLGLGHKFKGAESIMSYNYESSDLQKYDIEAVQALYPLQRP